MSTDRIISAAASTEDAVLDGAIRPRRLADYIGQPLAVNPAHGQGRLV